MKYKNSRRHHILPIKKRKRKKKKLFPFIYSIFFEKLTARVAQSIFLEPVGIYWAVLKRREGKAEMVQPDR